MNRVIHFEIHAADPERAAQFYRQVFGWTVSEWTIPGVEIPHENRYWLAATGSPPDPGIDGGILIRRGHARAPQDADQGCGLAGLRHGHRGQHLRHDAGRHERRVTASA